MRFTFMLWPCGMPANCEWTKREKVPSLTMKFVQPIFMSFLRTIWCLANSSVCLDWGPGLSARFYIAGSILDYAVTHEMGHAICGERQEKLAEKYGLDPRRGIAPTCATYRKRSSTP
jgi:hypothetical protein